MSLLVPKSKSDHVELLHAHTKLSKDDLKAHTLERLKELWRVTKPKKIEKVLPPSWKKMDLASLKALYEDHCLPYYGRRSDGHWIRWKRGQLLVELEIFEAEVMEERKDQEDLTAEDQIPLCHNCGLKMMERTNRLKGDSFWGCRRFPACRFTLPYLYDDKDTAEVQKQLMAKGEIPKVGPAVKAKAQDRKRGGDQMTRSSDGSWMPAQDTEEESGYPERTQNMNLTEDEVRKILASRMNQENVS